MEPKRVEPLVGVFNFLGSGMAGPREQITTKVTSDITVDTSLPSDTDTWETGIKRTTIEGKWVIVEQYEGKSHAEVGHAKWSGLMAEYPDYPLKDIDLWMLDKMED